MSQNVEKNVLKRFLDNLSVTFFFFRILTPYEAKSLVALLHARDCKTLERALVTISSTSAFTQNQDSLREKTFLCEINFTNFLVLIFMKLNFF